MLKLSSNSIDLKSLTKKYGQKLRKAHKALNNSKNGTFLSLPFQKPDVFSNLTKNFIGKFSDVVVIGMGGSILGSQMLFNLTKSKRPQSKKILTKRPPRVHFLDTLDPNLISSFGEILHKKNTLFIFISKSGDTLETVTLFEFINHEAQKWFGKNWRNHILIITENNKGLLHNQAIKNKLNKIELQKNVGGRYSVFTEAGLVPASFMDINLHSLLKGAQNTKLSDTLAATICHLYKAKNKPTLVLFPYISGFTHFNKWATQLIAESLGKNSRVGPLPLSLLGPSDQHSVLQLLLDGPKDKWVIFFELDKYDSDFKIGKNLSFAKILKAEKEGTLKAMDSKNIPSISIKLSDLSEESIGQLIQTFLEAVALAGLMFDINPFNQPAVELGKKQTRSILNK